MKYFLLIVLVSILCLNTSQAQDISAKLIDSKSLEPIPFATIQIDKYTGTITNEEGVFSIDLNNGTQLTFSCLGYQTVTISYENIKNSNFIIMLNEAVNELGEVYLSNKKPNIDSIISRIKRNSAKNYSTDLLKHKLFSRTSSKTTFKDVEFLLKKVSNFKRKELKKLNIELDSLSQKTISSNSIYYKDFTGNLYAKNFSESKLDSVKAIRLVDSSKDFSIDNVQEKSQNIFLKNLDTTKTYKVKSGLFKVEDSLSFKKLNIKSKEYSFKLKNLKSNAQSIINNSRFYPDSFINNLLNTKLYEHVLEDITYINGDLVYIITFTPRKSKAKFAGTLYVLEDDYAIVKVDYGFGKGKRGQHLNLKLLLGVKFSESVNKGTILFKKNEDVGSYQLHYAREEKSIYFYVNRPFKFTENSIEKNKIAFNIKFEGNQITKHELLITKTNSIDSILFDAIKEVEKVLYTPLKEYKSTVWKGSKVLAPLEEMKQFKVEEE